MTLHGWTGTLLRVDLARGRVRREPLDPGWARDYVGGRGLGARILWEELDPQVDPLAPENVLKAYGRGIFFMRQFMDEVTHAFPAKGGTVVRMIKRLPGHPEALQSS